MGKRLIVLIVVFGTFFVLHSFSTAKASECTSANEFIKRKLVNENGVRTGQIENVKTGEKIPVVSAGFRVVLENGKEYRSNHFEVVSEKIGNGCEYELLNKESGLKINMKTSVASGEPWIGKILEIESTGSNIIKVEIERFRLGDDEKGDKTKMTGNGTDVGFLGDKLYVATEGGGKIDYTSGVLTVSYDAGGKKNISLSSIIGVGEDAGVDALRKSHKKYLASKIVAPAQTGLFTVMALPSDYGKIEPFDRRKYFEDVMKVLGGPEYGPAAVVLTGADDITTAGMAKKYLNADPAIVVNSRIDGVGIACSGTFNQRQKHMDELLERSGKVHPKVIIIKGVTECGDKQDKAIVSQNLNEYISEIRNFVPGVIIAGYYTGEASLPYDYFIYGTSVAGMLLPPSTNGKIIKLTERDVKIYETKSTGNSMKLNGVFAVADDFVDEIETSSSGEETIVQEMILKTFAGGPAEYLNINFKRISDSEKSTIASVLKWAKKNSEIFYGKLQLIGSDPLDGKPYGYSRFSNANRGIVVLRNPGFLASQMDLNIDEESGFKQGVNYEVRIAYPYEAFLAHNVKYGDSVNIVMDREQVVVLEVAEAGKGGFVSSNIPILPSSGIAKARELKKSVTASGMDGVYIFSVPENLDAKMVMYVETTDKFAYDTIKATFVNNGDTQDVIPVKSFGAVKGEDAPSGWVMYTIPLKTGENRVGFSVVCPGLQLWSWLMTENSPASGNPVFNTGLPAKWSSVTKSDVRLF